MRIRRFISFISIAILVSCNSSGDKNSQQGSIDTTKIDSTVKTSPPQTKFSVIVLPTFDEIANAGTSPDIVKAIEYTFNSDSAFRVIPFPYKTLTNYYMIYDNKYCSEIIEKVNPDIIVMSKLVCLSRTGHIDKDTWDIEAKVYLPDIDTTLTIYSAKNIRIWALIEKDIFTKLDRDKIKIEKKRKI